MREGYKDSRIGELPIEWEIVKQVDVATFFNGRAYKLTEWETEGTPVIRLQNLTGTGKDYYYSNLALPEHQYCDNGDLLYMWSATFGPVWWKGEKAIYHYHIWKIEHDNKRLDRYFHFYLLDDVTIRMKNESHGSTMLHVTKGGMEKLLIQLPPLPEQQKIAEILSTVDDKIDVIDQQISETQALKKGLMQRLLTKGIGHTEFKDSPLGEIPKSWEVMKFSELISDGVISKIQDGNHGEAHPVSDDFVEEGIPFIMANCISISNKLNLDKAKRISFNQYKSLRIGFSELNDVLLTHKGTVGLTAIVEQKHGSLMLTPQVTYYRIGDETILNRKYLYYYFQSSIFQNLIEKFSKQSTRAYIGITNQKNLLITLPNDSIEQVKIAAILSSVDEKFEVLGEKKINYQELKQGLMQQLLTGKIRVNY